MAFMLSNWHKHNASVRNSVAIGYVVLRKKISPNFAAHF